MRITDLIDGKWIYQIDGKPTFRGVIGEYLDEDKLRWRKEATIKSYAADFNTKILPNLPDHDTKTMDAYTEEDFEQLIQTLKDTGKNPGGMTFQPYADTTIQHYRRIIYAVVKAAVDAELCADFLWGTEYALAEEDDEDYSEEIEERVRLKKSFTPEEEQTIADAVFTNPRQRGQEMGILMMDALGLRNNEACGADFGCIKPMDSHPEVHALWVYQTTKHGTSVLGSSGKSKNADRIIPIPDLVYDFLMERKQFVEEELERIAAESGMDRSELPAVEELPIACFGTDYTQRCASRHLTAACRELFRNIGISEKMMAYLDRDLHRNEYAELKEKDATAYTFRRNFGTHLFILGLEEAEIQYIMGHDVEDPYETRNEYVNEDRLYLIRQKMDQRPIFNTIRPRSEMTVAPEVCSTQQSAHQHLQIQLPPEPGVYQVAIQSKEPNEAIEISLHPPKLPAIHFATPAQQKFERCVDVVADYQRQYKK